MRALAAIAIVTAVAVAAVSGLPSAPAAQEGEAVTVSKRGSIKRSPDLWATVNICDTAKHPDRIGIRGSMPGLGRRTATLLMRFRVQYLDRTDGKWHTVSEGADSGFVRVGRTKRRVLEGGHTFRFLPPKDGGAHTLRGKVTFRWKAKGRVLKTVREITEGGHRSKTADPPGYSAAICRID
jgi:hypothetical protein